MNPTNQTQRTFTLKPPGVIGLVAAALVTGPAANAVDPAPTYSWNVEWNSLDLNETALMPLGPGWGDISTAVHLGESANLASTGQLFAYDQGGGQFFVQANFDVFLDFSFTDVDPGSNFGGGSTDGLTLQFPDVGPGHMQNFYSATFNPNLPNFGLFPPPESAPTIGLFTVEIPLNLDLNSNGEDDKVKVTLGALTVADENRTFIILPDGTVIDNFDAVFDLSGAVVDISDDPPFSLTLTGPGSMSSVVVPEIPEPGTLGAGVAVGIIGLASWWRRSDRTRSR